MEEKKIGRGEGNQERLTSELNEKNKFLVSVESNQEIVSRKKKKLFRGKSSTLNGFEIQIR